MIYVSAQIIATKNTTKNHPRGRFLEGSLSLFQENLDSVKYNFLFGQNVSMQHQKNTPKTLPFRIYSANFLHTSSASLIHLRSTTGAEKASWPKRGLDLGTGPIRNGGANRLGFLFGKDFSRGTSENPSEVFFVEFPDLILNMMFFSIFS